MDFKINHLQHVGIPVTDLDASEMFYQKLGFKNVMASQFDHPAGKGKVAMMQNGSVIVEIYQMPSTALAEIRTRKNGHIDHIAFDVDDIDEAFNDLRAAGFDIIEPGPVYLPFWTNGCKYFNILGPNGERLEFNQVL